MFSEAEPRTQGYTAAFVLAQSDRAERLHHGRHENDPRRQEPIYPPPGDQVTIYFGLEQNGL
jgi:hypothetical protein